MPPKSRNTGHCYCCADYRRLRLWRVLDILGKFRYCCRKCCRNVYNQTVWKS